MTQVDFFKCLSDQTRLDLVLLLVIGGERCVCDFSTLLNASQPKISRHLALLRTHKILQDRRQGQWIYYALHPELPQWCMDVLCRIAKEDVRFTDIFLAQKNQQMCCE